SALADGAAGDSLPAPRRDRSLEDLPRGGVSDVLERTAAQPCEPGPPGLGARGRAGDDSMTAWNATYLDREELEALRFRSVGRDVLVHRTAVLVGCERITLGDFARIDPFVLLSASGAISIGSRVHVSSYTSIMGAAEVTIEDYCNLSFGTRVFS